MDYWLSYIDEDLDQMVEWSRGALKIAKDYTVENLATLAPFGSFEVINLMTYAASTAIAGEFDVTNEALIAIASAVVLFAGAFLLLWLMASTLEDHAVRALPLVAAMMTTGLLYALVHKVFDLGRKPGEVSGQAV